MTPVPTKDPTNRKRREAVFVCQEVGNDPRLSDYTIELISPILRMSAEKHLDDVFVQLDEVREEAAFGEE